MSLTRRELLQRMLAAGVGLTLSEAGFVLPIDRTAQALAQPARRKLALLIGINQYPESVADRSPVKGSVLAGCLTDVELQRELLTARFGFLPDDILSLTDQQATRSAIVSAFQEHLAQAQAEDTVVVHFSGLGSRVRLEDGTLRSSIVPIDAALPTEENPDCTDLLTETLDLLLGELNSDRVITILDCGFSSLGTAMQGNLRLRARSNAPVGRISAEALALQAELKRERRPTILSAAAIDQPAVECQWNGFSAGLFTYALTQQLWQMIEPTKLLVAFDQASAITQRFNQQPQISTQTVPPLEVKAESGDGVIVGSEADGRFRIWLGGLPATVVEQYAANSLFEVNGRPAIVRSRDGLIAVARWVEPDLPLPEVGQVVQEAVRILPSDLGLTIALDNSLTRIERVDATSAFAALPRIAVAAGDHADYLFGKLQAPTLTASLDLEAEPAPLKGYGLFQTDRSAIASTLIGSDEAVKTAVTRLAPKLQTLLAIKLLRLTENSASSRLGVQASLLVGDRQLQRVIERSSQRVTGASPVSAATVIPLNSSIQYQFRNLSDRPVYAILIGLDSDENVTAYLPPAIEPPDAVLTLAAEEWLRQTAPGSIETHVIFSTAPFQQASLIASGTGRPMSKPIDFVQAVLQDLHQASGGETSAIALDVNHWATFRFAYRLVEPTG